MMCIGGSICGSPDEIPSYTQVPGGSELSRGVPMYGWVYPTLA